MKFALLSTLFAATTAFQAAPVAKQSTQLAAGKDDLKAIASAANPVVNFYDPLSLADAEVSTLVLGFGG